MFAWPNSEFALILHLTEAPEAVSPINAVDFEDFEKDGRCVHPFFCVFVLCFSLWFLDIG